MLIFSSDSMYIEKSVEYPEASVDSFIEQDYGDMSKNSSDIEDVFELYRDEYADYKQANEEASYKNVTQLKFQIKSWNEALNIDIYSEILRQVYGPHESDSTNKTTDQLTPTIFQSNNTQLASYFKTLSATQQKHTLSDKAVLNEDDEITANVALLAEKQKQLDSLMQQQAHELTEQHEYNIELYLQITQLQAQQQLLQIQVQRQFIKNNEDAE